MNANVPHNSESKHTIWGMVILICVVELCVYVFVIRMLWRRSKKKRLVL